MAVDTMDAANSAVNTVDAANAAMAKIHDEDTNTATLCHGELCKRAHEKMSKAALTMKKCVLERVGEDKACVVGKVVHVPLKDMDEVKVDSHNLMGVSVQVDKACSQARVAVKSGMLKGWYMYH